MYKTELPVMITLIVGSIILMSYFVDIPAIQESSDLLISWAVVISGFSLGLGAVNLVQVHSNKIRTKASRWPLSIWLLMVMGGTLAIGIVKESSSPAYSFLFANVYSALGATVYSLHAFFLPAAAFRAFRISNLESALFLLSGLLVMLGQVGIGAVLWGQFPVIKNWIMNVPNASAMRGITITSALGLVSTALRIIVGLDRTYLGVSKRQ